MPILPSVDRSAVERSARLARALSRAAAAALLVLAPLACSGGEGPTTHEPADPSTLYWELELDHHAVTLQTPGPGALYDTLTLSATPRNYLHAPLPDFPSAQYLSTSPDLVSVGATDGVLQAHQVTGQPVWIKATLTANNVRRTDSVMVRVVDGAPPPALASFSIDPADSAKVGAIWTEVFVEVPTFLPVHATDVTSAQVPATELLVSFRSSDTTTARVNELTGEVKGIVPGAVTFYASTTRFGVRKVDTLPYRIGYPVGVTNQLNRRLGGLAGNVPRFPHLKVGVGAVVAFAVTFGDKDADKTVNIDLTFSGPAPVAAYTGSPAEAAGVFPPDFSFFCGFGLFDCGGGDILIDWSAPLPIPDFPFFFALRVFPAPGTYEYHSALNGFSGRIVVVDES